jgi:hypothetical protein
LKKRSKKLLFLRLGRPAERPHHQLGLARAPDGTFYGASFNECGFALFGCGAQDNSGAIFSLKP